MNSIVDENKRKIGNLQIMLLGIVIFFMPFFRGLFFESEMYVVSSILSVLFLVYILKTLKQKESIELFSLIQYFALGFIFLYVINFPFAMNKKLAVFELIKNITFFMAFILIGNNLKSYKNIKFINYIFILSGVVVSIIGIGAAFGTITYKGAFEAGMISSTFQYHNAFGAFMLAVLFLAIGEITENNSIINNSILSGFTYLIFLGFILSYSRGAWMLLPLIGIITLIFIDDEGMKRLISVFLAVVIGFILSFSSIIKIINNNTLGNGWIWIFIGLVISTIIYFALDKFINKKLNLVISKKKVLIGLISIVIISLVLFLTGALNNFLPQSILERITSINLRTFTVVERSVFANDGLKIIKDYWVLGTGGGGWQSLYHEYQTYGYDSTQTHNYIVQVGIEIGILGIIALIGLYISFAYSSFNILKNFRNNRIVGVICCTLVLIIHSFMDFDMALGAYAIFLWTMLGIICFVEKENMNLENKKQLKLPSILVLGISVIMIISSATLYLGGINAEKGISYYSDKNYRSAMEYFEKASKQNPFNANSKLDLGNIQDKLASVENNEDFLEKANVNVKKALILENRDFSILQNAIKFYMRNGNIDMAVKLTENMKKHNPLSDETYTNALNIYYTMGYYLLQHQEEEQAKVYLNKILEIEKDVIEINNKLEKTKNKLLKEVEDTPEWYVKDKFAINLDEQSLNIIKTTKDILNK